MSDQNGQTGGPLLVQNDEAGTDFVTSIIPVYALQNAEILKQFRQSCTNFNQLLNCEPNEGIEPTPDGKARTLVISHVEMTLDEMFFGLWETYDFKWATIANEVVGSLILEVVHPVTGQKIRRQGAACVPIMVDSVPDHLKDQQGDTTAVKMDKRRQRNEWATSLQNKKPTALDMGFPRLKTECIKNAAQSLGKLFGRDLNREKNDVFKPLSSRSKTKADNAIKATEAALNGNGK
jgi:hypothetical protein